MKTLAILLAMASMLIGGSTLLGSPLLGEDAASDSPGDTASQTEAAPDFAAMDKDVLVVLATNQHSKIADLEEQLSTFKVETIKAQRAVAAPGLDLSGMDRYTLRAVATQLYQSIAEKDAEINEYRRRLDEWRAWRDNDDVSTALATQMKSVPSSKDDLQTNAKELKKTASAIRLKCRDFSVSIVMAEWADGLIRKPEHRHLGLKIVAKNQGKEPSRPPQIRLIDGAGRMYNPVSGITTYRILDSGYDHYSDMNPGSVQKSFILFDVPSGESYKVELRYLNIGDDDVVISTELGDMIAASSE